MSKIWYLPLEGYKERYTMQWSAPRTGWLERRWLEERVPYERIDPVVSEAPRNIKTGSVVDAVGRSIFCFSQFETLLRKAEAGEVSNADVIYLDDFWSPGVESLPYAFQLLGLNPKIYAFLHAQSVDEFDFTYPMRRWMRHYEKGLGEVLAGIFVCCPTLKDLVVHGGIAPADKVYVTGHPLASDEVMERMPEAYRKVMTGSIELGEEVYLPARSNTVVYSSRWDREKNPGFFLEVACNVLKRQKVKAEFVVCTGAAKLKSNASRLLTELDRAMQRYPNGIRLREGLTKEEYYAILADSKIQMNTADQDFVAITLLEASVAGCYPIYPYFRSFPETLRRKPEYMYQRLDVEHATRMIERLLSESLDYNDYWSPEAIKQRSWIHTRFDSSWKRMLDKMGFGQYAPLSGRVERNPYMISE